MLQIIHENEHDIYVLRKMHELDIIDKHDLVIPAVAAALTQVSGQNFTLEPWTPEYVPFFVSQGANISISKELAEGMPQPDISGNMTIMYPFYQIDNSLHADKWGGHVIPALKEFTEMAENIIESFSSI